jgi:peptidoglycan/LPS O-acetylase OafA/YrhL
LVFLGRISFGLYLVHVPLLLGMSHGLHGILPMGAILALWIPLTLPAAWILCRVVDEPAQRLARLFGAPKRTVPA